MRWLVEKKNQPLPHLQVLILALIFISLISLLYLPYLGEGIFVHEEPRRALIARTMMDSGNYLVPMLKNEIYTAKPPLYNWIIVLSARLFGSLTEFSARFSSVLSLGALTVFMLVVMRHFLSLPGVLMLGSGLVLTPEIMAKAPLNEIDLVFTFLTTASLWAWFLFYTRKKKGLALWFIPCLIVAFSFLAKREPAIIFFYFSITGFLLYKKDLKELVSIGHIASAITLLGIIGVWLWAMVEVVGVYAFLQNMQTEVIQRDVGGSLSKHLIHLLHYPLELMLAMLPYSLLPILLISSTVRSKLYSRYGDLVVFAGMTVLINLPIYLMREGTAVRYFLPMFPTLLVLCAALFEMTLDVENDDSKIYSNYWTKLIKVFAGITVVFVVILVANELRQYWEKGPSPVLPQWLSSTIILFLIGIIFWSIRSLKLFPYAAALPLFMVFGLLLRLTHYEVLLPRHLENLEKDRNVPQFVQWIKGHLPNDSYPIIEIGFVPRDVWYYLGEHTIVTEKKAHEDNLQQEYAIAYEHTVTERNIDHWNELYRIPYRGKVLVFGKLTNQ